MTDILQEASELINGQRAKDYGDVTENFARIANMWSAYKGEFFFPHDVAMMMILVKVARQSGGYHRDSAVDIAGYAALDEKVHAHVSQEFWDDIDQGIRETQKVEPRVWNSMHAVPDDVMQVKDKAGDQWYKAAGDRWLGVKDTSVVLADIPWPLNPFTEVL